MVQAQRRSRRSGLVQVPGGPMWQQDQRVSSSPLSGRLWFLLVASVAALLCLPFIRAVFGMGGDEAVLLNGAERMLRGATIYVDFFEFLPPGGFVLTQIWFGAFGVSFFSARSLAILVVVGIACFTYLACRQACKNDPLSALLATGWVVTSQGIWTQISHHWFTTLFAMVTVYVTLFGIEDAHRRRRWPLIAGTAAGMAAMITTHRGAIVALFGLVAFLNVRRRLPELIAYVIGCTLVPGLLIVYLIGHHALAAAFNDVILFTAARYAAIQGVSFGFGDQTPLTYLFPLAALMAVLLYISDWHKWRRDRLLLQCSAFALAGFIGCFPRPDVVHIAYSAPLACPLFAYCVVRIAQRWRSRWWRYRYVFVVTAGTLLGLCAPTVIFFVQLAHEALRMNAVPTPRGNVVIFGPIGAGGPELLAQIEERPREEAFFFYPVLAKVAFLAAREQVSKYDVFVPGYTSKSQYHETCLAVMRFASWVVIDRRWTDPVQLKYWFPAMVDAEPKEATSFTEALDHGFEFFMQAGAFEMRRRRASTSDALCAPIVE